MITNEQILQEIQTLHTLFEILKVEYPIWYASLRVPALELERRAKKLIGDMNNG